MDNQSCFFIWFVVTCFQLEPSDGMLIVKPQDTYTSLFGQDVEMQCSTDSVDKQLRWYYELGQAGEYTVYRDGYIHVNFTTRYHVDTSKAGEFNLVIRSLQFSDAGRYTCYETTTESTVTGITVLSSSLNLTSSASTEAIEGEAVSITCALEYRGNQPALELTINSEPLSHQQNTSQDSVSVSQVTGHVILSRKTSTVGCRLTDSSLIPLVELSHDVLYCPTNCQLVSSSTCSAGTLCSAESNPESSFIWREVNSTSIIVNGTVLTHAEPGTSYQCTATNNSTWNRAPCSCNVTCTEYGTTATGTTPATIDKDMLVILVGAIVGGTIVLIVVILVGVVFARRKYKGTGAQTNNNKSHPLSSTPTAVSKSNVAVVAPLYELCEPNLKPDNSDKTKVAAVTPENFPVYSKVDKSAKKSKKNPTSDGPVYAQVDKSGKDKRVIIVGEEYVNAATGNRPFVVDDEFGEAAYATIGDENLPPRSYSNVAIDELQSAGDGTVYAAISDPTVAQPSNGKKKQNKKSKEDATVYASIDHSGMEQL